MNDLISRQDAIALVNRPIVPTGDAVYDNAKEDERKSIKDDLISLPSAEPKTGKWIEVEINEYEGFNIVNMRCNQCGRYAYLVLPKGTKCVYDYCPWCKVDMRGEEE